MLPLRPLLILLFFSKIIIIMRPAEGAWAAAAVSDTADSLLFFVPKLLEDATLAPVLALNLSSGPPSQQKKHALAVGATALAYGPDSTLWVAMPTCIILITTLASTPPRTVAGECLSSEGGSSTPRRDGPPLFARFQGLSALAVAPTSPRFFAAVDGDARLLVLGTPWQVASVPGYISLAPIVQVSVLVAPDRVLLLVVLQDRPSALFQCVGCVRSAADGAWSQLDAPFLPAVIRSGLLLPQATGGVWCWFLAADGGLLRARIDDAATASLVARTPSNSSSSYDHLAPGGSSSEIAIWAIDLQNERLLPVPLLLLADDSSSSGDTSNNNNSSNCTASCHLGEALLPLAGLCVRSPPGGYVVASDLSFVPCPAGTYNPDAGAVHPDACRPCPPFTSNPLEGAARCAACPAFAPLQAPSRTRCLAMCPPSAIQTEEDGACLPCPLPGYYYYDAACTPCPAMTATLKGPGWPCEPCPAGTVADAGASACTPTSSPGAACVPQAGWSYALPADTYEAYTLVPTPSGDCTQLAAARNGTLWLVCAALGLLRLTPVPQGAAVAPPSHLQDILWPAKGDDDGGRIQALALPLNEASLFVAARNGSIIIVAHNNNNNNNNNELVAIAPRPYASIACLCLAAPAPTALERLLAPGGDRLQWLFWLTLSPPLLLSARPGSPTVAVVSEDPGLQLIAPDTPDGRGGLLVVLADADTGARTLYHFDPLGGVFTPLGVEIAPEATWLSAIAPGLLAFDRIHAIAIVVVTTDSTTPPLLVGDAAVPGHVDGATTARLILPTAPFVLPPASSSSSSADDPLLLFLEPATAFVRAIIRRGCECAEDHRRAGANLCLPCAAGLHAEAGDAAGCSVCPAGEYLDPLGLCTACPLRLWWRDPHLPCARLRSTYPYLTGTLFLYTLAEAQALVVNDATLLNQQHCWAVQSTAWSLFHVAADDPPEDVPDASWLLRADLLGPFWRAWYDPPPSPLLPDVYDPDGVAAWGSPPLLAQCASPDAPCACRLPASAPPPLLLGEPGPPWNAARQRAPPGLLFFMLDPNPGGGGPWPISSSQGGEEWAVTDGTCVGPIAMGWPAVRRCVSPVHRWAYPTPATPGGACLPCASGTFAPSDYDTACAPPTDTLGGPAQCPPGMFLQLYPPRTTPDVIVTRACLPCPAGTYAPGPMVGACRPKAVLACPPGAFLFDDGLAQADNECRPCVPCPPGKVPLPADAPCAGGATRYQAYLCLPDGLHALPGYALRFVPPPTSILLPDARRLATVAYVPCGARPPAAAVWATGPPYAGVCYFRCMYALPTDGGAAYYAAVRPFLPASILVDGGRIVPAALGDAAALLLLPSFPNASATAAFWATGLPDRVCPPCVPTACPIGTFRVHGSDPCPPCMLAPELCTTTAPSSVPQHAMGRRLLQQPQEEPSSFDTTTETTTDGGGSTSTDTASWSTETPTAASTTSSFDEISSSSDEATTTTDIATTPDDTLTTANETTTAAATDTTATLDTYDNMTTTAAAATTATPPPQTEEEENATTTTTMLTGEGFTTPADTTPLTIANNINNNNSSTSSGSGSSTLILPTGCVPLCDAVVPSNAHAIRADCAWRCDDGWFLARDGGACLPCDAASACAPGQRFLPNACVPTAKAVCADCPPQDLATLVVPVQGTFCRYACLANLSYPNPDPFDSRPCLPCTANTTTTGEDNQPLLCAPGMYLDASACPPECLPCPTPFDTLGGTALLAPTADAICRVQCRPGFHTLVDGEVLLLVDGGQDPARTACEPCAQRPRLPCGTCPAGTAAPAPCTPCLDAVALGCPPGTYAPPCPGGAVLQPLLGCLRCPPSLILAAPEDNVPGRWPTRFFLPPGAVPPPDAAYIIPTTTETDCLTACVPDAMLVQLGGGRRLCRGCDTLPVPYGAPYRSYAARWNATPGRRWWPAGFDPLHLPPRAHRAISPIEPRAGLCWPCPLLSPSDTHVNNNDDDLCIRPAVNNNDDDETVAFVVVADDDNTTTTTIDNRLLAIRYDDEPSIAHARDGPTVLANRRLLQDVDDACAPGTYASAAYTSVRRRLRWCTPCPSGAACPPGATAPVPCPPTVPARLLRAGQSACPSPQTPSDLAEGGSGCPPGYAILHDPPWSPPRCEPCPPGAFGTDGAVCHACPPAHTTEAAGATACTPLPPTPALTCETTLYERVSVTSFPPVCACAPGAFFRHSSHIIIQRTRFDDNNDGGNNNDKNKRNGTATTAAIIADNNDDGGECWPCPPNTHSPFVGNAPCISIDNNNNHP